MASSIGKMPHRGTQYLQSHGLLRLECSHPGKCFTLSDFKIEGMLSPIISDPFPHLFKILNADEDHFFPGNIYQSAGHFRYEGLAEGA